MYVPRDEVFGETKQTQFTATTVSSGLKAILQSIASVVDNQNLVFSSFEDIDMLFKDGFSIPQLKNSGLLQRIIPTLVRAASDSEQILRFDTPEPMKSKHIHMLQIKDNNKNKLTCLFFNQKQHCLIITFFNNNTIHAC